MEIDRVSFTKDEIQLLRNAVIIWTREGKPLRMDLNDAQIPATQGFYRKLGGLSFASPNGDLSGGSIELQPVAIALEAYDNRDRWAEWRQWYRSK